MNSIPSEIISLIASHLNRSDRLNCMRLCRRWYSTLFSSNLYEEVRYKDLDQILKSFRAFNKYPEISSHVHYLIFDTWFSCSTQILDLLKLFPGLKYLKWTSHSIVFPGIKTPKSVR